MFGDNNEGGFLFEFCIKCSVGKSNATSRCNKSVYLCLFSGRRLTCNHVNHLQVWATYLNGPHISLFSPPSADREQLSCCPPYTTSFSYNKLFTSPSCFVVPVVFLPFEAVGCNIMGALSGIWTQYLSKLGWASPQPHLFWVRSTFLVYPNVSSWGPFEPAGRNTGWL